MRLVFTTADDWFGRATRAFSRSPISHVAIGLGDHGEHLLHAHDDGVVLEPRAAWVAKKNRVVAEYLITPDVSAGVAALTQRIGEPWSAVEATKIVLRRLFNRRARRWIPRDEHTCAQFVMLIDPTSAQISEWRDVDRSTVVPGDLLRVAEYGTSFQRLFP